MEKRLFRSRTDRMLFGVCGGLAKYFGIDPSVMRIIVVLLAFATAGVGILIYFLMAFIVPLEGSEKTVPKEVVMENVEDVKTTAQDLGKKIEDTFSTKKAGSEEEAKAQASRRNLLGIIVIAIGVVLLFSTIGIFKWGFWAVAWPVLLIATGVVIILGVTRR